MQQAAVVGQQQQPRRIAVEPADRRRRRVAIAKARRQQVVHDAAGITRRARVAGRLVQRDQHAGRRIERFAVAADVVVRDARIFVDRVAVCLGEHAVAQHRRHVAAAAVAEVGQQSDEFHRSLRVAAITLYPCSSASTVRLA